MPKYIVRYTTKDGDYEKEWLTAINADDAKMQLLCENWNIKEITSVSEIK